MRSLALEIDREGLIALAHDLPAIWNAPGATMRTKQRLTCILIQEVVIDLDDAAHEAVVTVPRGKYRSKHCLPRP
jgi:hypothetical protein